MEENLHQFRGITNPRLSVYKLVVKSLLLTSNLDLQPPEQEYPPLPFCELGSGTLPPVSPFEEYFESPPPSLKKLSYSTL